MGGKSAQILTRGLVGLGVGTAGLWGGGGVPGWKGQRALRVCVLLIFKLGECRILDLSSTSGPEVTPHRQRQRLEGQPHTHSGPIQQ